MHILVGRALELLEARVFARVLCGAEAVVKFFKNACSQYYAASEVTF